MSYFFISAAHKSSGKTTLSIGLTAALRNRGMCVQTFKKGPDYIDPLWLTAASGRPCVNLDFFTMDKGEILDEFGRAMQAAEIGVIEGNKGLYDGLDLDGSNSNAALAAQLQAPVFLVIDARGMTRGIAPLILGYQAFDPDVRIAGVILNKVGGSRHEAKLCNVIKHYTDIPVVGSVHNAPELVIDERHLGLMPSNETDLAQKKIAQLGETIAKQVDMDQVLRIAADVPIPAYKPEAVIRQDHQGVRIGYPRDQAFGFYYPGDLEKMSAHGVELVAFDALHDAHLPPVDGLFIGGGFPEMAMDGLTENVSLRQDIRDFIEQGGPVYAECGGLMYLARRVIWNEKSCDMVGAIPADVRMHERPQGRGYVRLQETEFSPWPKVPGSNDIIAAHEFHYSALENIDSDIQYAYKVTRGTGIDGINDGIVYKNLLASYTHMRDVGGNHWIARFLAHVRQCKHKADLTIG
ncbi:cobyrinate a,c-diamide synthase [Sedimenticola selenatireducens]|uniref:Hydrogenobyrinic acid a,c-diamide synthase (Glutamine-hydrolyzing) n=1 Tax=Sedimenticola selenatireducens TaxID=191960 RepID=A0A557SDJ6_9GAMM|nr:cobyrinate a,c-diamide synthase [Sedimenticola selenatireducens]TVO75495.1 hydrogenobyrinic acid a,c-diamide synthase (glutamine-hydrolyzing) [Sedimenticola selenatireducens]TVT65401.1 MAG: hydrogenobyrinic acid a,c-diamide synthase (glutamine-hydrolyzing) [Sedimenticola selenatireducens]